MYEEKREELISNLVMWFFLIFIIGTFITGIGFFIHHIIEEEADNNYCKEIYPSQIEKDTQRDKSRINAWADRIGVEDGYIRCCRNYWEDHERKEECKIFPYGDEE